MRIFYDFVYIIIFAASLACVQKRDSSDSKNIESLEAGKNVTVPRALRCGPNKDATTTKEALSSSQKAIPSFIAQQFNLGSHHSNKIKSSASFELATNAADLCKKVVKNMGSEESEFNETELNACWAVTEENSSTLFPIFIIKDEVSAVYSHTVPMSVLAFNHIYIDTMSHAMIKDIPSDLDRDEKTRIESFKKFTEAYKTSRLKLAKAFLQDLKKADNKEIKKLYAKYIEAEQQNRLDKELGFLNFVTSQTVDSYYCSPESFDQLHTPRWELTREAFGPFIELLGKPWFFI
jgi:hypothetical protein